MATVDVMKQPNSRIMDKRRSSELEHIHRIRTAYEKARKATPRSTHSRVKRDKSYGTDVIAQPNSRILDRLRSSEENHIKRIRSASEKSSEVTPRSTHSSLNTNKRPERDVINQLNSRILDRRRSSEENHVKRIRSASEKSSEVTPRSSHSSLNNDKRPERDVINQPNSGIMDRRRSSELAHIIRIRGASSDRQLDPLRKYMSNEEVSSDDFSSRKSDMTASGKSGLKYTVRKNYVREDYPEDFSRNKFKHRNSKGFPSISIEKNSTQRPSKQSYSDSSKQKSKREVDKSRKATPGPIHSYVNADENGVNSSSELLLEDFDTNAYESRDSKSPLHNSDKEDSMRRISKQQKSDASEKNLEREADNSREISRRPTHSSMKTDENHEPSTSEQSQEDLNGTEKKIRFLGDSDEEYRRTSKQLKSNASEENLKDEGDKSRIHRQTYNSENTGVRKESALHRNTPTSVKKESDDEKRDTTITSVLQKKQGQSDKNEKNLSNKSGSNQISNDTDKQKHSQNDHSDNINSRDILQEKDKLDHDFDIKQIPTIVDNIFNKTGPLSVKDIIVLKWLHDIKCPGSSKEGAEENESEFSSIKKFPIRVLKKPLVSNSNENTNGYLKPNTTKSGEKEIENASKNQSTESLDAEMYLTDLGKLQIVIDAESLSPEHAAVIVWLGDLPENFVPDHLKQLSLNSSRQRQLLERFKRESVPFVEDLSSPNPNATFPSVSLLTNLAVDFKTQQKS